MYSVEHSDSGGFLCIYSVACGYGGWWVRCLMHKKEKGIISESDVVLWELV